MPELPEVHTVVSDLNREVAGFKIIKPVTSDRFKIFPSKTAFIESVENREITSVKRLAKNILIELDNGTYIHFHLAMTGRILLRENTLTKDPWTHVAMKIKKGGTEKILKFTDTRMFGKAGIMSRWEVVELEKRHGPDAWEGNITPEEFLQVLHKKKTTIKNALLDQNLISGLGNIYATDALYLAGINPTSKTNNITTEQVAILIKSIKQVLSEGIEHRGSTLPDKMYVDIFGNPGSHQNYFKIYMKENCPTCGGKTSLEKINGRNTYYCPVCQKN